MIPVQLDLFDMYPELDTDLRHNEYDIELRHLRREVKELRQMVKDIHESTTKVRKALFARHGELSKLWLDDHQTLEIIKRNLCHV